MKSIKKLFVAAVASMAVASGFACSRVTYLGDDGLVLVGRTLDWRTPIPTNLYVYPQGVSKESMPEGNRLEWTSKYGSVVAVSYDGGVTEGMNEKGLVVNGLFCKESVYKVAAPDSKIPVVSLAMFPAFFLDNFATVEEVAQWLAENDFAIYGKTFDGGTVSLLHWAMTDASGDTILLEYVDGQLTTYRGRDLQVLTNDPVWPQMQAINKYWKAVGGVNMLPGTVRSTDRFVRADFFIHHVPTNVAYKDAWGSLNSIMGTVSVPFGYQIEGEPNVSSTQWRSIADPTTGKYYFKFAVGTGDFWIDLQHLILKPGAPILKLDTVKNEGITGNANKYLKKSSGFTPMW